jgi:hypothetical protein
MANGAKVALAVGAGYFLGRTRKMRIALMVAGAGLTGKFPAGPGGLVTQGLRSLGASDQLHDLTDQLRGEVLTAARAAAMAAATNRVDALNNRLQGVVPTEDVGRAAGSAAGGLTSVAGLGRNGRPIDFDKQDRYDDELLDVDEQDEGDAVDEDFEDEDFEDQDEDSDFDDEDSAFDEDDLDEEPEDEPPARRRAVRRSSARRAATVRATRIPSDSNGDAPKRPVRRRASASAKPAPVRRNR